MAVSALCVSAMRLPTPNEGDVSVWIHTMRNERTADEARKVARQPVQHHIRILERLIRLVWHVEYPRAERVQVLVF